MKEPKRYRAMVEAGRHETFWRIQDDSNDNHAAPWADRYGRRWYWEQLDKPRRLIFGGVAS